MSEYYEGKTEGTEGMDKLEDAFNRAVGKYFDHHKDRQGSDVTFRLIELSVIGSHNPIHGYRVVLRAED
ncbi:MAG TPA: hypothetical protein VG144_11545 [Gaiellaceae bacterium]|jgi:hypothetical protein|nr:hypothetical protein [Gaiellaceae bacterium]